MVNICVSELLSLGLSINAEKSACLRIGPRFKATVAELSIGNLKLIGKMI